MSGITEFQQTLWATNMVALLCLLSLIVFFGTFRRYPAFSFYLLVVAAQNVLTFFTYRELGHTSVSFVSWAIYWATQGVVVCARAAAVIEVCQHILRRYSGVWALAWRILAVGVPLVIGVALFASRHQWILAPSNTTRALELAMAFIIVSLLFFAYYYDVPAAPADRVIATGFCLYSCFTALNNTVLERLLYQYGTLWDILGMVAYFSTLLIWIWALRRPLAQPADQPVLFPASVYQQLSPQIDLRLRLLDRHLTQIWSKAQNSG